MSSFEEIRAKMNLRYGGGTKSSDTTPVSTQQDFENIRSHMEAKYNRKAQVDASYIDTARSYPESAEADYKGMTPQNRFDVYTPHKQAAENLRTRSQNVRRYPEDSKSTLAPINYQALTADLDSFDQASKVSEGNIKTMQRVLGLQETGKWTDEDSTEAGGLTADKAWKNYQKGQLQNYKSVGLGDQGLANGNVKAMERMLGLKEDGYWSEEDKQAAGGLSETIAWEAYQRGLLQKRNIQVSRKGITEGDIKSMERVLGLTEDGVWSEEDQKAAKGFSAATAWEVYKSGALQQWKTKGLFDQGISNGTDKEKTSWEKKYSDMTYSELRNAINDLEDGPEKDCAISNLPSTRLDYTKTLQKTKGELGTAIALKDEDQQLKKRLQVIESGSEEAKQIIARRAEIYSQFGDLDDYIDRLNEDIWWLEREEKYKFLDQNEDFAELSKRDYPFMDWTYVMANDPTKARRWENAAYIHGLASVYNALNYDNLHLMKDNERAIFNYVYAKEGKAAAKEYLDYLQYELNKRSADFWNEGVADLMQKYPVVSHIIGSLLSTPIALTGGKGLTDAAWQNIRNAVTGDDKPIDYNRDAMLAAQLSGTIRDTAAQDIEDAIGASDMAGETSPMNNGKFLAALYQLAMDMQDSAAVVELSKIHPAVAGIASGVMGDTAGTQEMLDAKRRGATDEKALKEALLSVFYDMLFDESKLGTVLKYGGSFLNNLSDRYSAK